MSVKHISYFIMHRVPTSNAREELVLVEVLAGPLHALAWPPMPCLFTFAWQFVVTKDDTIMLLQFEDKMNDRDRTPHVNTIRNVTTTYKVTQKPKHCWKEQIGHQSTCLIRCSHIWEYSTVAPGTVIFDILSCVWFTRVCYKIKSSVLNILSLHVVFAIDILMLYVTVVFEFAWVGCETRSSDLNI